MSGRRRRLRSLLLLLIAIAPGNASRVLLYRALFGYRIDRTSRIGAFNYLDVGECDIEGASIGRFNEIRAARLLMRPGSSLGRFNRLRFANLVTLEKRSVLRSTNTIIGTAGNLSPYKAFENYYLGADSIVTCGHHFDLSDGITIEANVTFAGRGSQVWTHGFDPEHTKIQGPVHIGSNVYIASRSLILQCTTIASDVSIGAGTVVAKSIAESGFYVSSELVRKGALQNYGDDPATLMDSGAKVLRRVTF